MRAPSKAFVVVELMKGLESDKVAGQVIGDITTTRISLEEGAYFNGYIEIERAQSPVQGSKETEVIPVSTAAI
jgi:cytoskeletal protein CcmA (bactofilin family)